MGATPPPVTVDWQLRSDNGCSSLCPWSTRVLTETPGSPGAPCSVTLCPSPLPPQPSPIPGLHPVVGGDPQTDELQALAPRLGQTAIPSNMPFTPHDDAVVVRLPRPTSSILDPPSPPPPPLQAPSFPSTPVGQPGSYLSARPKAYTLRCCLPPPPD